MLTKVNLPRGPQTYKQFTCIYYNKHNKYTFYLKIDVPVFSRVFFSIFTLTLTNRISKIYSSH